MGGVSIGFSLDADMKLGELAGKIQEGTGYHPKTFRLLVNGQLCESQPAPVPVKTLSFVRLRKDEEQKQAFLQKFRGDLPSGRVRGAMEELESFLHHFDRRAPNERQRQRLLRSVQRHAPGSCLDRLTGICR